MTESRQVRRALERASAKSPRFHDTHANGSRAERQRRLQLAKVERRPSRLSKRRVVAQILMGTLLRRAAERGAATVVVSPALNALLDLRAPAFA